MSSKIKTFKRNMHLYVDLTPNPKFERPKAHDRLPKECFVGLDTETFPAVEGEQLFTTTVQLAFADESLDEVINVHGQDTPFLVVLEKLFPLFAIYEEKTSYTKQRPRRPRDNEECEHRDGRRQSIPPVVLIAHNLEYDFARLVRNNSQFRKAILFGQDSVRVQLGEYEIEIAQLIPNGSAPQFELFVRKSHKIMRVLGRDTFGYFKMSLEEACQALLNTGKLAEMNKELFEKPFACFTPDEIDLVIRYAIQDARRTRELYEATVLLLMSIDERVITSTGLIPSSAPGAAARIAFSLADPDEWYRPTGSIMQIGANTYCGARVFCAYPGYHEDVSVWDLSSAYPHVMSIMPDPATSVYTHISEQRYVHEQWKGKWGCMLVSGYEDEVRYPSLRTHDLENNRMVYVTGRFENVFATIPEIVIGVERGTLIIDTIKDGYVMQASGESFLKKFIAQVYQLKSSSPKNGGMYLVSKLLMNSLYGKLVEVRVEKTDLPKQIQLLDFPQIECWEAKDGSLSHTKTKQHTTHISTYLTVLPEVTQAYITDDLIGAIDALDDPRWGRYESFCGNERSELKLNQEPTGKAGQYYLPFHGAQITGYTSAQVGCAAFCTDALYGDTDSIHVLGDQTTNMQRYQEIIRSAGYSAPDKGLGAFDSEGSGWAGWHVKPKVYGLANPNFTEFKLGHHSISRIKPGPGESRDMAYFMAAKHLYEIGEFTYQSEKSPRPLLDSLRRGLEPGEFVACVKTVKNCADPNTYLEWCYERRFLPYKEQAWVQEFVPSRDDRPTLSTQQLKEMKAAKLLRIRSKNP